MQAEHHREMKLTLIDFAFRVAEDCRSSWLQTEINQVNNLVHCTVVSYLYRTYRLTTALFYLASESGLFCYVQEHVHKKVTHNGVKIRAWFPPIIALSTPLLKILATPLHCNHFYRYYTAMVVVQYSKRLLARMVEVRS